MARARTFGVWSIQQEHPAGWWTHYHCVATASEHGDSFRLICEWADCLYALTVYKNGHEPTDIVFTRLMFADANCRKFVRQVMRIPRCDVSRRLARLDQLLTDLVIGVGAICREEQPSGSPATAPRRGLLRRLFRWGKA